MSVIWRYKNVDIVFRKIDFCKIWQIGLLNRNRLI